jgi:hypothetical protein
MDLLHIQVRTNTTYVLKHFINRSALRCNFLLGSVGDKFISNIEFFDDNILTHHKGYLCRIQF